jgi:hypothetical protein
MISTVCTVSVGLAASVWVPALDEAGILVMTAAWSGGAVTTKIIMSADDSSTSKLL